jgi:hypothetical protein
MEAVGFSTGGYLPSYTASYPRLLFSVWMNPTEKCVNFEPIYVYLDMLEN